MISWNLDSKILKFKYPENEKSFWSETRMLVHNFICVEYMGQGIQERSK